jgi:deoxyadenosine/deoxycytidine kinase
LFDLIVNQTKMASPIIISLDGNIGAGKSTLCALLAEKIPELTVVQEPVGAWEKLVDESGVNLISHFYHDTTRWAYTFQNCAILTRLINTIEAIKKVKHDMESDSSKLPIILSERSVLTDRYVFAEMMKESGHMNKIEWDLYMKWFEHFAAELPIRGIVHVTTSPEISKERISKRGRVGEESIDLKYLVDLDKQHAKWLTTTDLPVLHISTEEEIDSIVCKIKDFMKSL